MTDPLRARFTALVATLERLAHEMRQPSPASPYDRQQGWANDLEAVAVDLAALLREPPLTPAVRELLVRADSLLSLLWHRHVPADRRDVDLERDVDRTIQELRHAAARAAAPEAK